jgi:hypothetical protein
VDIFAHATRPTPPISTIVGDKYGSPDGIYVVPSGASDPDRRSGSMTTRQLRRLRQQPDALRRS